jgi:general stress protein YciG
MATNTSNWGFASMDEEKQREIARKGGESVPPEKRSFSKDHELASEAGRKGGESVPSEKRSFRRILSSHPRLAARVVMRRAAISPKIASV